MSMIVGSALGNIRATSFEDPNVRLTGEELVKSLGLDDDSWTGKSVSPSSALAGTVAVYACTSLIAESGASLPLQTFRRVDELRRESIDPGLGSWSGRLARMLHSTPNPEITAAELWENFIGHYLLWGNGYLNTVRGRDGRPRELWPLRPDKMEVLRDTSSGQKFYRYTLPSGETRDLRAGEVLHIKGLSLDGLTGLSRIQRNAVGMEQAGAEFAGRFFSNSAMPGGIITLPDADLERAKTKAGLLKKGFEERHAGLSNAHRIAVLYGGATWQDTQMPLRDAQFLEQRSFQIAEIARMFRVPLHMIQMESKDTSWGSGIEQLALGFLTFTLRPILEKIEAAIDRDLGLVQGKRTLSDEGYYAEFNPAALLRTDAKSQAEAFEIAIRNRWMSPQQVAGLLNLPFDPDRPDRYENPNTTGAEGSGDGDMSVAELTLALQKIYLSVGVVISADEAREILNRAGAGLEGPGPEPNENANRRASRSAPPPESASSGASSPRPEEPAGDGRLAHIPAITIEMPDLPTPEVTVNVPAPIVNVEPPVVRLPEPPPAAPRRRKIVRDEEGKIASIEEE